MSFWSVPYLANGLKRSTILCFALSVACARKHFPELVLITDRYGRQLLRDFPYDRVECILENQFIPREAEMIFAAGKLMAFQWAAHRGKPFIHFDGDFFLRLYSSLLESPIVVQSDEAYFRGVAGGSYYPSYIYERIAKLLTYMPGYCRFSLTRDVQMPYNTGVCGGTDLEFFKRYSFDALATIRHTANLKHWKNLTGHEASVFVEQYIIGSLAAHENKEITVLFPSVADRNEAHMKELGIVHLLGGTKELMERQVEDTLKKYYPWMYDLIEHLVN